MVGQGLQMNQQKLCSNPGDDQWPDQVESSFEQATM